MSIMKEEWLFQRAAVPVDAETTAALVAEIKRLIDVVGGMALAQPVQEPVAWGVFEGNLHDMFFTEEDAQELAWLKGTHAEVRPLYTIPHLPEERNFCPRCGKRTADLTAIHTCTPPLPEQEPDLTAAYMSGLHDGKKKRTWVGLTDDEKETLAYDAEGNTWTAVELAEAKLKEKNNG
jgi:hypothetical protein